MRIIYPTDFVRTTFVRVTKSDQSLFNVDVYSNPIFTENRRKIQFLWYNFICQSQKINWKKKKKKQTYPTFILLTDRLP